MLLLFIDRKRWNKKSQKFSTKKSTSEIDFDDFEHREIGEKNKKQNHK